MLIEPRGQSILSRELEDQGDSESGTINLSWDAIEEMIGKEFDGRSFTVKGFVLLSFWFSLFCITDNSIDIPNSQPNGQYEGEIIASAIKIDRG
ncbi:hypothetical protein AtEden1_Chr5g0120511 [Arabidopsis thaliana]